MTSYRCYTLIKALVEGARKQMIHSVSQIAAARRLADQVCLTYILLQLEIEFFFNLS